MTSLDRALAELAYAGLDASEHASIADESVDRFIGQSVAELLKVFSKQGHSGASAPFVASLFYRLVRGEVLSPLTGEPQEWIDVSESYDGKPTFQNKRCFSIFAEDNHGKNAYNVQGRIFTNVKGASFSCSAHSSTPVVFPCIPVTEYIREGTPEAEEFKDVFDDEADS